MNPIHYLLKVRGRISITPKMFMATVAMGIVIWGIQDYVVTNRLREISDTKLREILSQEMQEDRIRFENYLGSYHRKAELLISDRRLIDYVLNRLPARPTGIKHYSESPPWLPEPSVMREIIHIDCAVLLDGKGKVREVYQKWQEPILRSLVEPSDRVIKSSLDQSFLTYLDGVPVLLTSVSIRNSEGGTAATVVFAALMNDDFLISTGGLTEPGKIIGLVTAEKRQKVIASNRPDLISDGIPLDIVEKDYVGTGKPFFDWGTSEVTLQFTSFMPKSEFANLNRSILNTERRQRLVISLVFILSFLAIMVWMTRRIRSLTDHVIRVSDDTLETRFPHLRKGDEFNVLMQEFQHFTSEIVSSREVLEKRVEERTEKLALANRDLQVEIDERKKIENALDENKRLLETVIDKAPVCIKLVSKDGLLIKMNRAGLDMLGAESFEDLAGKSIYPVVSAAYRPAFEKLTQEVFAGTPGTLEFEITGLKGKRRWLHTYAVPLYGDEGRIDALLGTTLDITDRKRAEEALHLTKFSVDHASIGSHLLDRNGRFLYVNDQMCRSLGYTREELLAMSIPDVDPDFPAEVWQESWEELRRRGLLNFETRHRRKDGSTFPVEISANYVEFSGKEYNWAFAQDISKRKAAEEELKQSHDLTRTIMDNMKDAISLIDVRNHTIAGANRMFVEQFGDEAEIMGKPCYAVTHGRDDACCPPDDVCPLAETVRTGNHSSAEHIHLGKGGKKMYVEVSTSPIRDASGTVTHVVHVARDITERKLAEEQITDLNRLLVHKVDELAFFNKELESFSYSVSHDLRAPLRIINSFSQIVAEDQATVLSGESRKLVDSIRNQTERMDELIKALLSLSQVGRQEIHFARLDMEMTAREIFNDLKQMHPERTIQLTVRHVPTARGDAMLIRQVLSNLIENAIKFTSNREKAQIEFEGRIEGNEAVYSIKDNGVGFDMQYAEKLFAPFQRLTSRKEFQGTGLGLSIVQRIIQRHRGRIWAESEPGNGATFWFALPLSDPSPGRGTRA